jgi:hypothetical protein
MSKQGMVMGGDELTGLRRPYTGGRRRRRTSTVCHDLPHQVDLDDAPRVPATIDHRAVNQARDGELRAICVQSPPGPTSGNGDENNQGRKLNRFFHQHADPVRII